MNNPTKPSAWFVWITAVGAAVAVAFVAASWLNNIFHVMGPSASDAERQAFSSDQKIALFILAGSAMLGQAATLVASGVHRSAQTTAECWSERYRNEVRSNGDHS